MKNFSDFYNSLSLDEIRALAKKADTHPGYLWQIATGRRKAGAGLIERLMAADSRTTFQMMRNEAA